MPNDSPKQAACLNCRKSKVKCNRNIGEGVCKRCQQQNVECEIPEFHVGRQRGVKNKRKGLEKAIFQVEQAIRKSKETPESTGAYQDLQRLIDEAQAKTGSVQGSQSEKSPSLEPFTPAEEAALDDAENPLNLLARASDLRLTSSYTPSNTENFLSPVRPDPAVDDRADVHRFFKLSTAIRDTDLENGADADPIDLGLVTSDEAAALLAYFYENLAHTRWGMDQRIHNLQFLRAQSAFLLTSILAASSLFIDSTTAMATRLSNHRRMLAQRVVSKRCRSVEIVLAFMVNVPWMQAGQTAADDDTGFYISMALSIALDLSLDKIVVPTTAIDIEKMKRVSKAHCIDARKALLIDGFPDVNPESEWGQLLLRRRERAWLALFVLERGVCLARGRSFCVPSSPLLENCDRWHQRELSSKGDGPMISVAVLRRDLDDLFSKIRARCDSYRTSDVGSQVKEEIESSINTFFNTWLTTWAADIGEGSQKQLPPYVEILLAHTRLSTYAGVMNHPTAPHEVKRLFQTAGLSSALNVMRAAIQGEARLSSMPNNTAIMISFAAGVALNLSTPTSNGAAGLAPSVRSLIEEAADVLERIGSITQHRNGMSTLYGKFLRELIRNAPAVPTMPPTPQQLGPTMAAGMAMPDPSFQRSFEANGLMPFPTTATDQFPAQFDWTQPLQFSAMSNNQINETVQRAGNDIDMLLPDVPFDSSNAYMWDSWMPGLDFGL